MKVKKLIIGNIAIVEPISIPKQGFDYLDTENVNIPMNQRQSVFYKIGNHAFDIIGFGCYKLLKEQEEYPDKLKNKKIVIYEKPFDSLSVRNDISRREAILVYENRVIK